MTLVYVCLIVIDRNDCIWMVFIIATVACPLPDLGSYPFVP